MSNEQLVARIKAGINVADNMLTLWQKNRGLINKIANKYKGYSEYEDLQQEGYIALCNAVDGYDSSQGTSFSTYAYTCIAAGLYRYLNEYKDMIRVPEYMQELIYRYNKFQQTYLNENGVKASDQVACEVLEIPRKKLTEIKKIIGLQKVNSLDQVIGGEDGNLLLEDMIASDEDLEENAMKKYDLEILKKDVAQLLETLPNQEREVLHCIYWDCMTRKETAAILNIHHGIVRSEEQKALRTLRKPENRRNIEDYYNTYLEDDTNYYKHIGVSGFQRNGLSSVESIVFGWIKD